MRGLFSSALALVAAAGAVELDVNSTGKYCTQSLCLSRTLTCCVDSIRNASTSLAYNLLSWYQNNQSSTSATAIGTVGQAYIFVATSTEVLYSYPLRYTGGKQGQSGEA